MTEPQKEPKKPRATLAVDGKRGIDALMQLVSTVPKAATGPERLAKAREEREKKINALLTPQVKQVIKGLREKGYGFAVIANTITDTLAADPKITTRHVKAVCEPPPPKHHQP